MLIDLTKILHKIHMYHRLPYNFLGQQKFFEWTIEHQKIL